MQHQIERLTCCFLGANQSAQQAYLQGDLEVELVPMVQLSLNGWNLFKGNSGGETAWWCCWHPGILCAYWCWHWCRRRASGPSIWTESSTQTFCKAQRGMPCWFLFNQLRVLCKRLDISGESNMSWKKASVAMLPWWRDGRLTFMAMWSFIVQRETPIHSWQRQPSMKRLWRLKRW